MQLAFDNKAIIYNGSQLNVAQYIVYSWFGLWNIKTVVWDNQLDGIYANNIDLQ